ASGTWSVVRGLGLIESTRDLEDVVVAAEGGVPVFVRQVATVKVGDAFRAAALVKGTDEAVGGVVVARYGVSTVDVITRIKEKIQALQAGLPAGVKIVPFYDRSALIERAVHTLRRALIEETIVVTIVNIIFLLHFRSVLIVTIPLFALTGQEGKLGHPLAFSKLFSMVGATILSVALVPVLCSLLSGGRIRGQESNPIMRPLVWVYRPVLDFALRNRAVTLGIAV